MITRPEERHLPQIKRLWKDIFSDSDSYIDLFFRKKYRREDALVYIEEDSVVSMLFFLPYSMKIRGGLFAGSYVCGAATHPAYRGQGIMAKLLTASFEEMRLRENLFSFIIPANRDLFPFYEKHGYLPLFKKGFSEYSEKFTPAQKTGISISKTSRVDRLLKIYREITENTSGIVLQDRHTYAVAAEIYEKSGGDIFLVQDKRGEDTGFIFAMPYGRELCVHEIMSKSAILDEAASILSEIYSPAKIIMKGPAGSELNFQGTRISGMLKHLKKEAPKIDLGTAFPYMNMMLDFT